MTTNLIRTRMMGHDGTKEITIDQGLPIIAKGTVLSLPGYFSALRVTDIWLHLDADGNIAEQVLFLGTGEANGLG